MAVLVVAMVVISNGNCDSCGGGDDSSVDNNGCGTCGGNSENVLTRNCKPFLIETCVWEQPYCEPTYEFKRVMTAYSRSLPPPTRSLATLPPPTKTNTMKTERQTTTHTPTKIATTLTNNGIAEEQTDMECKSEDSGGIRIVLIDIR